MKRISVLGAWVLWCGCAVDATASPNAPDAEADALVTLDARSTADARSTSDALSTADAQVGRDAPVTPDVVDAAAVPDATSLEGSFACDGVTCASGDVCVRQYGGDAGFSDAPPVEPIGQCRRAPSPCADLVDCDRTCTSTCAASFCIGTVPSRVQGRAVWCMGV